MQSLPQSDIQKCQTLILTCLKVFHQSSLFWAILYVIGISYCYSLVEMAMKEGKGTQNHQNMVKIICDKLVDSQIELNSSEF